MIKKREIVDRAFKLLGMSGFVLDDSPEDEEDMLQQLDDLMSEIQAPDYDFGYLFTDESYLDDDSGIQKDAVSGIAHKLALRTSNLFGINLTQQLLNQSHDAYNALLTKYHKIPEKQTDSQCLAYGAGNREF